jgi:NTE family protein
MAMADSEVKKPKVALVIGSGGIKCVAALGLWKVLKREGIEVDMAVGCSGGSLYASVIAQGRKFEDIDAMNVGWWTDTFGHLYYPSLFRAVLPQIFGFSQRFGLVDDRKINASLRDAFGDGTFAQTHIPLYILATDLNSGDRVVLSEGRVFDAVRASIAIPVLIRPWEVGGRLLFDGGAVDPLPVSVAIQEGCEIILAMGFESPNQPKLNSMLSIINQTSGVIMNNLLKSTFAFYSMAHHAEVIPILPTFDRPIEVTDVPLIPYIIEQGEKAAEEQMPYLRRLLAAGLGAR